MVDVTRKELFDQWALQYDRAVSNSEGEYPFDGYDDVLSTLVTLADPQPGSLVLDLGTGTGNVAGRFVRRECSVWGIDFSKTMLEETRARFPELKLVHADLLGEWPQTLPTTFDLVVSAYVLHEFDAADKVRLIRRVAETYLKPGGRILIADIAFPSVVAKVAAARHWSDKWDDAEHYWAAEEAHDAIEGAELKMAYQQVSSCAGIIQISKIGQ